VNLLEQIVLCPISRVTGHLGTGTHTPVSAFTRTLLTIGQSNGTPKFHVDFTHYNS